MTTPGMASVSTRDLSNPGMQGRLAKRQGAFPIILMNLSTKPDLFHGIPENLLAHQMISLQFPLQIFQKIGSQKNQTFPNR